MCAVRKIIFAWIIFYKLDSLYVNTRLTKTLEGSSAQGKFTSNCVDCGMLILSR